MRTLDVLVAPWIGDGGSGLKAIQGQVIKLPGDVNIDGANDDLGKEVIKACLARGLNFDIEPYTSLDHFYVLTKEKTRNPAKDSWDDDASLTRVLNFSRLIQPNAIGYAYCGQVDLNDLGGLAKVVPFPIRKCYSVNVDRHWLDAGEWDMVAKLLTNWDNCVARKISRINSASWYSELLFWEYYVESRWPILATANLPRRGTGRQFCMGIEKLGKCTGIALTPDDADSIWKMRSQLVHGRQFPTGQHVNMIANAAPLYITAERILLAAIKLAFEDDQFSVNFQDEVALETWITT